MKFAEWLYLTEKKFEKEDHLTPTQKAARQRKKNTGVHNLAKNISSLEKKISADLSSDDEGTRLTAAAVRRC